MLFRVFSLTVDWNKFHAEVTFLKDIFRKNSCPLHFIDQCIKIFLDKGLGCGSAKVEHFPAFLGKFSNEVKDRLPMHLRSKILYRFTCNGCNSIYYGKTRRHFVVRAYEHLGFSLATGKEYTYNPNNNNAILNHLRQSEYNRDINDFEIIGRAKNDFFLRVKASLLKSLSLKSLVFPCFSLISLCLRSCRYM